MALLHRMKKVLNPVNTSIPEDDFKILDSWTESDKEAESLISESF